MEAANRIIMLSEPAPVSMANSWYQFGTPDHFWVRHRNTVFDRHFGNLVRQAAVIGEVGCGHGLILSHIAQAYGKAIDGLELNLTALKLCPPLPGNLYVYDIFSKQTTMTDKYDLLVMLDVLEHIEAEIEFLQAVRDHLKPGGWLIIGVPMRQHLYSPYDEADGHYRRYSSHYLRAVVRNAGLQIEQVVEWGHIYIPILMVRQLLLRGKSGADAIKQGFAASTTTNRLLSFLKYLDFIPTFGLTGSASFLLAQRDKKVTVS